MGATWLISDTHFGHEKMCTEFKRDDGSPVRHFSSAAEMDEILVENWNKRVKPNDKVYHLGDVVIHRSSLKILALLNGDKILIRGNHDIYKLNDFSVHFRDIRATHMLNGWLLSHYPVHPESFGRCSHNVHGHLHYRRVMLGGAIDHRYFNVSVEQIDYAPISVEELAARIKDETQV